MTKITFVEPDGTECSIDVDDGLTLMEAAVRNNVRGIAAECGGACACATCHVYVDNAWISRLDAPSNFEELMLDAVKDRTSNSRLACQISIVETFDGLIVRTPSN